jgi:hypothetical protein
MPSTNESAANLPKMSASLLDNFWLRMAAMFGHPWVSQYGAAPDGVAGETWAAALSGITPVQIAEGLRATLATGAEWPPSAPRFRAMCLGIPDFGTVRREMQSKDTKRSRFTILVWQHIDAVRFHSMSADKADNLLREAYKRAHELVMRGHALPDETVADLPPPAPVDHASRAMDSMREFASEWGIKLPVVDAIDEVRQ